MRAKIDTELVRGARTVRDRAFAYLSPLLTASRLAALTHDDVDLEESGHVRLRVARGRGWEETILLDSDAALALRRFLTQALTTGALFRLQRRGVEEYRRRLRRQARKLVIP